MSPSSQTPLFHKNATVNIIGKYSKLHTPFPLSGVTFGKPFLPAMMPISLHCSEVNFLKNEINVF